MTLEIAEQCETGLDALRVMRASARDDQTRIAVDIAIKSLLAAMETVESAAGVPID